MNGPSLFRLTILFVTIIIYSINFVFLNRIFVFNKKKKLFLGFLLINFLACAGIFTSFNNTTNIGSFLSLISVFWLVSQIVLLLPLTFLYIVTLFKQNNPQKLASVLVVLSLIVSAYGSFYESQNPILKQQPIVITTLDSKFNGFKIAQLSDVHLGIYFTIDDLKILLDKIVQQKPDVIVITGDLIDNMQQAEPLFKLLDEYEGKVPLGIYYCWGNHEYMRDSITFAKVLEKSKIKVLKNKGALLANGEPNLYILGVDYSKNRANQASDYQKMLDDTLKQVDKNATKILIAHHSMVIDTGFTNNIDLTITGHTHGTQVFLFDKQLLPLNFKYIKGLYKKDNLYGYVSTGVSSWMPFRFNCLPEVAIITLQNK